MTKQNYEQFQNIFFVVTYYFWSIRPAVNSKYFPAFFGSLFPAGFGSQKPAFHQDISTTLNIYADVTKELKKKEFENLDTYFT